MEPLEIPTTTATDMTLVLGAESYIDNRRNDYNDPWGKECLRDFVDLVLNSEKFYFTLPGKKNKGVPSLISELSASKLIHRLPDAAIHLKPSTEKKIFNGFANLVLGEDREWIWDWLKFQLINPIVTEGHRIRVGSMTKKQEASPPDGMISDDGYQTWKNNLSKALENELMIRVPTIEAHRYLLDYLRTTSYKFRSEKEFFLCYAFDVYRRGWQYMGRVNAADIRATYFPHKLRNSALENSTGKWRIFHQNQKALWSWGDYIVTLIEEYKLERSPQRIAERIIKIQEAMQETKCPKWFNIGTFVDDDPFRVTVQEKINRTIKKAKLPMLRIAEDPQAIELVKTIIEIAFNLVPGPISSIPKGFHVIIKTLDPKAVGTLGVNLNKLEMSLEEDKRKIVNLFYKGTVYGYPGLVVGNSRNL